MAFLTLGLVFVSTILTAIYFWMQYQFSYWKRKNIPYIPPKLFVGSFQDMLLFRESAATALSKMYFDSKMEKEPIIGIHIFQKPGLLIKDVDIIKQILVKDFNHFSNRYSASDPHSDGLGGYNLFFIKNPTWKQLRNSLTPIFTSGKMKQMFHLVNDIGNELDSYLCSLPLDLKTNSICKELKDICALFTTDVIASVAFGIQANSIKNPNGEFRQNGRKIFEFNFYRAIEFISFFFFPQLVSIFKFKVFSKDVTKFLRSTLEYVINEREKNGIERNDLIDILISLKRSTKFNNDKNNVKFDGDILVAQAALFFSAGFETSSSTMAFGLYELSKHPEIQNNLREEIKKVLQKNNGTITYEVIQNMEYLDKVVKEILRFYPPLPFLDRECQLPKGEKGYSLEPISDFKIPNGMPVYIPIFALHRDEKHFPNPEVFDPERFAPENKQNIHPYSYMPFGLGPRNCIGERFGLMQAKIGLVHFLKNHYVRTSIKTQKEMKLEKKALIIQAEGGIYCDIVRDPLIKEFKG